MKERIFFAGTEMTKARAVSLVVNTFIDELMFRARREGGVRDYYDLAVVGYSGDGVRSLISPDGEFTTPSRLAASGVRREKFARERLLPSGRSVVAVTEHSRWICEKAAGITPMCGALREGLSLVEWWCRAERNAGAYPPTVINITDGETSDGNDETIRSIAQKIRDTGTSDGHTLFMNIHLARRDEPTDAVLFPSSPQQLPDHRYARLLWDVSSTMPAGDGRAVGWGCHIGGLAAMMNIGSINSVML
ncbi:MAG: VWA domain-containing protein [Alistipes sp.]|jgi:hypothetical protein|nr:VWA domain-containing protein [Alistipes sp.]